RDCIFDEMEIGIVLESCRLWKIESCSFRSLVAGSIGIDIRSLYDAFCGDHWIDKCNIEVATSTGICINMTATTVTAGSSIRGIHIDNCVLYNRAIKCESTNLNSDFSDIWISDCACDGGTDYTG